MGWGLGLLCARRHFVCALIFACSTKEVVCDNYLHYFVFQSFAVSMEYHLRKVIVNNRLNKSIRNVQVKYAQSDKSTTLLSYSFNWKTVDVTTKYGIMYDVMIDVGDVKRDDPNRVSA